MSYGTYPTGPRRRPVRRRMDTSTALATAALAVIVIALLAWLNSCVTNQARRSCEARGGYFTQVSLGRHSGWSCTTPPRVGGVDR